MPNKWTACEIKSLSSLRGRMQLWAISIGQVLGGRGGEKEEEEEERKEEVEEEEGAEKASNQRVNGWSEVLDGGLDGKLVDKWMNVWPLYGGKIGGRDNVIGSLGRDVLEVFVLNLQRNDTFQKKLK